MTDYVFNRDLVGAYFNSTPLQGVYFNGSLVWEAVTINEYFISFWGPPGIPGVTVSPTGISTDETGKLNSFPTVTNNSGYLLSATYDDTGAIEEYNWYTLEGDQVTLDTIYNENTSLYLKAGSMDIYSDVWEYNLYRLQYFDEFITFFMIGFVAGEHMLCLLSSAGGEGGGNIYRTSWFDFSTGIATNLMEPRVQFLSYGAENTGYLYDAYTDSEEPLGLTYFDDNTVGFSTSPSEWTTVLLEGFGSEGAIIFGLSPTDNSDKIIAFDVENQSITLKNINDVDDVSYLPFGILSPFRE